LGSYQNARLFAPNSKAYILQIQRLPRSDCTGETLSWFRFNTARRQTLASSSDFYFTFGAHGS